VECGYILAPPFLKVDFSQVMKGGYILALRSAYDLFSQVMKGGKGGYILAPPF
jgi:hypothetical protein